ncbi:hypothetical protein LC653_29950 [Nostoc sp. CHAB 5784]|uniref:hypothetical protein n=1 Tax=Nostoc mirabile TaxID=2907820 RepID=UPI001E5BBE3F|nr:hypothetical protein [Nostoc mirabile]MCC5667983.1 hypothetical protein [Nostoc mirabile CHAB5784]
MDIALLVKVLAPCLPFLMSVGNKAVEGASQKVGEDVWNKAKAIWEKLHLKVEAKEAAKEAATDVAKNPENEDLQTALRVQLKKILESDSALVVEITKILEKSAIEPSTVSITQSVTGSDNQAIGQMQGNAKAIGQVHGNANM